MYESIEKDILLMEEQIKRILRYSVKNDKRKNSGDFFQLGYHLDIVEKLNYDDGKIDKKQWLNKELMKELTESAKG